jgi:hypothetical protein
MNEVQDVWVDIYPKKSTPKRDEELEALWNRPGRFPLRITAKEWADDFAAYSEDAMCYRYDRFTLITYLSFTGNVESGGWDYQDVYEVVCPHGKPRKVTFGPHKTPGLAKKKAFNYLVKHGAVEIISK